MIHTSRQLKALVRNRSRGDSTKAQLLIRSYIMERFLERISLSPYREKFILKGGMLISSMVGVDYRSTMDMDTTVRNMPLSADHMEKIVQDIIRVPIEDGITFGIKKITEIMEEEEYGGIRLHLEAVLDTMKIPLKLDVSTGDIITPKEITYQYWLMFEERTIPVLAYNLETVLAEKLETVLRRGTANTRLRDFYDLFLLQKEYSSSLILPDLKQAFTETCRQRETGAEKGMDVLNRIRADPGMERLWENYRRKFEYAEGISWDEVMGSVEMLYQMTAEKKEEKNFEKKESPYRAKDRDL